MASARFLTLSFLSILCLVALTFYTIIPQGPELLFSFARPSRLETGALMAPTVSNPEVTNATKFDPQLLLSAPRRSSAVPNADGDSAVYTVATYSFESHVKTYEIRVLDVSTGESRLITNDDEAGSPTWLAGRELLWLKQGTNSTELIVGHADEAGQTHVAATVPALVSELKVKQLSSGRFAIVLASKANQKGELVNPAKIEKPRSTALLYDNLFVRHWDEYVTPNKNSLWHGVLEAPKPGLMTRQGDYSLGKLTNILEGSHLESPIAPFGGGDDFDVAESGIIFVAKDPALNPALNTKSSLYLVSVEDRAKTFQYSAPLRVDVKGLEGASSSPKFSSDGSRIVFLQMRQNGYESDQNQIVILDTTHPVRASQVTFNEDAGKAWDRSPGSVSFGHDSSTLYFTAEDRGRAKLFTLELSEDSTAFSNAPKPLTEHGAVSSFSLLGSGGTSLLVSGTSFIDNRFYSVLDTSAADQSRLISSSSQNGSFFHLAQDQVSEIWFDGAGDSKVHAWVIKPSFFEADETYPLAYLIHGGPQGSWAEAWSTRWNPMVFAEQGYVVILPDPTGSTGYGQQFTDNIQGQWGGLPYQDLKLGFEYIEANLPFVDTDRAVALGASYGGYTIAWMQGHSLAKRFKALVCHDGSFILPAQLASDEQYFPNHDMGGSITTGEHRWDEWSPHLHISNWTTPMLVIHNELDYRLPISEGLAMFNVLQERGIKSRFLSFPDENHWVLKEENSLVWHTIVLNWINSFVGLPRYKDEADLGIVVQN